MTTPDAHPEDIGFGHLVVQLGRSTDLGRVRAPTADLLLAVLSGEVEVTCDAQAPTTLCWGEVLSLPRGRAWRARAPHRSARLLVVAAPPGPEQVVAALCADPPLRPQVRLGIALEQGVELLL